MENDVERSRRLQKEEEQRISKQLKQSNVQSDSQVSFGSEKGPITKVEKVTEARAEEIDKEVEIKVGNFKARRRARKHKVRLSDRSTWDVTEEDDSSPFPFVQLIVGLIGISIVLLVGYMVFNQVREALPTATGDNESITGTASINLIFDSFPYIIIPFALLIFFIMFRQVMGGGRMNFMTIALLAMGGGIFFSIFKPVFSSISKSVTTSNATSTTQSFISISTFSNMFGIVAVGTIILAALGLVNMFKSDI